jgi:hypothetical protein
MMRAFVCTSCGLKLYRGGRAERECPACQTPMKEQAATRSMLLPVAQHRRSEQDFVPMREARQGM